MTGRSLAPVGTRLLATWRRARASVSLALFGGSGALTLGTVQHLAATCPGGNCAGCGSCVSALGVAAGTAAAGLVTRVRRKRPATDSSEAGIDPGASPTP